MLIKNEKIWSKYLEIKEEKIIKVVTNNIKMDYN